MDAATIAHSMDVRVSLWRLTDLSEGLRYGSWDLDPSGLCVVPRLLSGSDYSGSLVERSNHDAWARDFADGDGKWWAHAVGSHGTYAIVIRAWAVPEDQEEAVTEFLAGLQDYPLADEGLHSGLEIEAQNEAWDRWARTDFRRALEKAHGADLDHVDGERLWDLFGRASERSGRYWENQSGPDMWIDVDKVAAEVTAEEVAELAKA